MHIVISGKVFRQFHWHSNKQFHQSSLCNVWLPIIVVFPSFSLRLFSLNSYYYYFFYFFRILSLEKCLSHDPRYAHKISFRYTCVATLISYRLFSVSIPFRFGLVRSIIFINFPLYNLCIH